MCVPKAKYQKYQKRYVGTFPGEPGDQYNRAVCILS